MTTDVAGVDNRLGLNVPAGWWADGRRLRAFADAGFAWVQTHAPPLEVLRDEDAADAHARALRAGLASAGRRLVLHAPDALRLDGHRAARDFRAVLRYARLSRAERVVYHGANWPRERGATARLAAEAAFLRTLAADADGTVIAVENLAPVYRAADAPRVCHDPRAVAALVASVDDPAVGMCFDLGHAHLTDTLDALADCAGHVALLHVHDNLGAGPRDADGPHDPLRLDLHLPPGAGTLPWPVTASRLPAGVPLQLEVHPPHRRSPAVLVRAARTALGATVPPLSAAPAA